MVKKKQIGPQVTIGQINFEAYSKLRQGLDYRGESLPTWDDVSPEIKEGWEVGAQAVLQSSPAIIGEKDIDAFSTLNNALDNLIAEKATHPDRNKAYEIMIVRLNDLIANYVHWIVQNKV